MKLLIPLLFLLGLFALNISSLIAAETIPDYLESVSVKIKMPDGTGSGVIFTRKDSTGTNDVSFILTVGHLFEHKGDIFSLIFFSQIRTNPPVMDHALVLQPIYNKNGEMTTNENTCYARLIKYSESEKDDIAILQLETNVFNVTAKIDDVNKMPKIGYPLLSVSAPFGVIGTFSTGVYSTIGRDINGYSYDQTTCVVYPGSSGGGYFTTNGLLVGLVDIMQAPQINYMVPLRRIIEWTRKQGVEWAIDPSIPMPTKEELKALPIMPH